MPMAPRGEQAASGSFLCRTNPGVHELLKTAAADAGLSLNRYCTAKLTAPIEPCAALLSAPVVERAAALFGDGLLGVAIFGSWVRGQATDESDVDLLIVVDRSVPLTRSLYRSWDGTPLRWDGHALEPHFVHLPEPERDLAGIWAEVAIDGVVLFERRWALSRRLAAIRREIAEGRIVRSSAHGQPYWKRVA